MKSLEEYLEQAAKGGSIRSGIIFGIRMDLVELKRLGIDLYPLGRLPGAPTPGKPAILIMVNFLLLLLD